MQGGAGNDVLDGGSGVDVAQYAGSSTDFDVVYNVAENTFTVTDEDAAADGDEGTDTVSQVGQIDFLGDSTTMVTFLQDSQIKSRRPAQRSCGQFIISSSLVGEGLGEKNHNYKKCKPSFECARDHANLPLN